jgi:hypothetical protein
VLVEFQGQVHGIEQLGCKAARAGKKALEDAHEAWMHGWLMEIENTGKIEHLKTVQESAKCPMRI